MVHLKTNDSKEYAGHEQDNSSSYDGKDTREDRILATSLPGIETESREEEGCCRAFSFSSRYGPHSTFDRMVSALATFRPDILRDKNLTARVKA